jgi:glycosyltransferase involved in cell wall biosynthesis
MNRTGGVGKVQPIVFVDDAHTYGGAQIALAWAIRAVLHHCSRPVICICTAATRDAIQPLTGNDQKFSFIECKPALPINILTFPLRLWSFSRLLAPLLRQGVYAWWFNLSGIEFCLAPLCILRWFGVRPIAWLHNSETFQFYTARQSATRRLVGRLRDAVANRFAFGLYKRIVTPSHATEERLKERFRRTNSPPTGFLYPIVGLESKSRDGRRNESDSAETRISLWMISRVEYVQKNNLACLHILKQLLDQKKSAYLTVVGDGPDMPDFRKSTRDMGLSEFVEFKGWQKSPWELVPDGGIVLIPSAFEAMPMVATEAMRQGVRMVTSPIPAFYEGSPNELIARDFSIDAFVEKVGEVSAMSREQVSALYEKALTKFADEAFVAKFKSYLQMDFGWMADLD